MPSFRTGLRFVRSILVYAFSLYVMIVLPALVELLIRGLAFLPSFISACLVALVGVSGLFFTLLGVAFYMEMSALSAKNIYLSLHTRISAWWHCWFGRSPTSTFLHKQSLVSASIEKDSLDSFLSKDTLMTSSCLTFDSKQPVLALDYGMNKYVFMDHDASFVDVLLPIARGQGMFSENNTCKTLGALEAFNAGLNTNMGFSEAKARDEVDRVISMHALEPVIGASGSTASCLDDLYQLRTLVTYTMLLDTRQIYQSLCRIKKRPVASSKQSSNLYFLQIGSTYGRFDSFHLDARAMYDFSAQHLFHRLKLLFEQALHNKQPQPPSLSLSQHILSSFSASKSFDLKNDLSGLLLRLHHVCHGNKIKAMFSKVNVSLSFLANKKASPHCFGGGFAGRAIDANLIGEISLGIDLTEQEACRYVLALVLSDEVLQSAGLNKPSPFVSVLFSTVKSVYTLADSLSIVAQLLLAHINITCLHYGLTDQDFGKLLDASNAQAQVTKDLVQVIMHAMYKNIPVEPAVFQWFYANASFFQVMAGSQHAPKAIADALDEKTLTQRFYDHYPIIYHSTHVDEYCICMPSRSSATDLFIAHRGLIGISLKAFANRNLNWFPVSSHYFIQSNRLCPKRTGVAPDMNVLEQRVISSSTMLHASSVSRYHWCRWLLLYLEPFDASGTSDDKLKKFYLQRSIVGCIQNMLNQDGQYLEFCRQALQTHQGAHSLVYTFLLMDAWLVSCKDINSEHVFYASNTTMVCLFETFSSAFCKNFAQLCALQHANACEFRRVWRDISSVSHAKKTMRSFLSKIEGLIYASARSSFVHYTAKNVSNHGLFSADASDSSVKPLPSLMPLQ